MIRRNLSLWKYQRNRGNIIYWMQWTDWPVSKGLAVLGCLKDQSLWAECHCPSPHLHTYTSVLIKYMCWVSVLCWDPHDCAGFPACLCFQFCLSFVAVMLERKNIACTKSLSSYNLTLNIGQIHHYWLLLFSRLSELEKETSNCLESETQTEQEEEESSEAVSTCPSALRYDKRSLLIEANCLRA